MAQDKDLDQIPGRHYNWTTGEAYQVSAREGLTFFFQQILSGDSTDNIPGLTGTGPVKAKKMLEKCVSPRDCAQTVFEAYGGDRDTIDRNAKLLWIWRKQNDSHPFWTLLDGSSKKT